MQDVLKLRGVEQIEITSLVDNYVDLVSMDSNQMITRALPMRNQKMKGNVLAEHGFSALIKNFTEQESHSLLFDFGYSEIAAPYNLQRMGISLHDVETMVLSHGHRDHFGAFLPLMEALPNKPIPLYLHPHAFLKNRYVLYGEIKARFPSIEREEWEKAGAIIVESKKPRLIAADTALFLGEIERTAGFEKGMPNAYYEREGEKLWDPIADDTAMAMMLNNKGLVIVTGCAHSGIINTARQAMRLTGIDKIHALLGGFHLSGPAFEGIIEKTIEELENLDPDYIIPTHCTGHKAMVAMEKAMSGKFILNMSGTRITFRS